MQIKKVAVLTLALAFVAGFFAPLVKADSIQKELENGVLLLQTVPPRKEYKRTGR